MIVRWGLDALPGVLEELSVSDPLVISTERWRELELPVERRFHGAQPHAEVAGVREALAEAIAARPPAKANPRPAPAEAVLELLEETW